jgi:uncharacterized membrane protein
MSPADKAKKSITARFSQTLLAGIFTVLPLWITAMIIVFVLELLSGAGNPISHWLMLILRPIAPDVAASIAHPWVQSAIGISIVIIALCLVGWITRRVIGRKLIELFDRLMNHIPIAKMIYGTVKKLLTTFQQKPDGVQRVVLIDFPSPEMKTIGLVTRTFIDKDTGKELAAVYVPTTPNPTSGYLEIVPLDKVTSTTMTVDEAMSFIVSGGAVAPEEMNYEKSAVTLGRRVTDKQPPDTPPEA